MERYKILLIVLSLVSFGSCSMRDFADNDVLKEYYNPPEILFLNPVMDATYNNYVDVIFNVQDTGGISYIRISTTGATTNSVTINLSDLPKSIYVTNRFFYQIGGDRKTINVEASDNLGNKNSRAISFFMQVVTPYMSITSHWFKYSTIFTNVTTLRYTGWSFVTNTMDNYPVSFSKTVIYRADGASFNAVVTNIVKGTNFWYCDVTLKVNQNQNITIRSFTDLGSYTEASGGVTCDTTPPTITINRPVNGGAYPWSFDVSINASDDLSSIMKMICYMSNIGLVTNYNYNYYTSVNFTSGLQQSS
jgi:hypothetical protein